MKKNLLFTAISLCLAGMAYGQWTYDTLLKPRNAMAYGVLGDNLIMAGGYGTSGSLSDVEIYDPDAGQGYATDGSLFMERGSLTGVVGGGKFFCAGGAPYFQTPSSIADVFDAQTQEWSVEQLSQGRLMISAVSAGNKVFFAGGFVDWNLFSTNVVDIYDLQTQTWSVKYLSLPRGGLAGVALGDLVIFAGGMITQFTFSDRVDIYNMSTNTWSTASLSVARAMVEVAAVGNKVFIAGGITAMNVPSDVVDIYDISSNTWSTASLSAPRSMIKAATLNGKVYFVGGGTFNFGWNNFSNIIDIYNEEDDSWSIDNMPVNCLNPAIAAIGDYLVIAGGENENGAMDLVQVFHDPLPSKIIHVPADFPTIQEGINAATPGDTVLVADGLYYENINFMGKKPLVVASQFIMDGDTNHINNTTINGSQPVDPDLGSVVTFTSGEDTTSVLCGFTVTGGSGTIVEGVARAGGGVFIQYSGGKLLNNHIEYNSVSSENWAIGGGVCAGGLVTPMPWVVIRNNRINHNEVECTANDRGEGGGVLCFFNLVMTENLVSYNKATGGAGGLGGGAYLRGDMGISWFNFCRNTLTHNEAIANSSNAMAALGGGFVIWQCHGIAAGNLFSFNVTESPAGIVAGGSGAFIELVHNSDLVFENNWILNNSFIGDECIGGGLCLYMTGGTYQNNVIQNNAGTHGGGIHIVNSPSDTAILINNTITGNNATGNGTGLYISSSNAVVINSILYNNTPPGTAIFAAASNLEVRYSDVEFDAGVYPGEGNQNCVPIFEEDGYHLSKTCQLVEAGIASIEINGILCECPAYDIDGDGRPLNEFPEIGADEVLLVSVSEPTHVNGSAFNIYPNPASGIITVELTGALSGMKGDVSFIGITGKELLRQQVAGPKTELNVSALAAGVYFIKLIPVDQNAAVKVGKFVKK